MTGDQMQQETMDSKTIRSYRPNDQKDVSRLYIEGLLAGQIAPNDTGEDIENVAEAYFGNERSHLWVATINDRTVGMIAVAQESGHTAEIRRLRVDRVYQPTSIAAELVETAIRHCQAHGYLKVVFDTRIDPQSGSDAIVEVFDRFGFQHTRTKTTADKELHEFYLDLYRQRGSEADSL